MADALLLTFFTPLVPMTTSAIFDVPLARTSERFCSTCSFNCSKADEDSVSSVSAIFRAFSLLPCSKLSFN